MLASSLHKFTESEVPIQMSNARLVFECAGRAGGQAGGRAVKRADGRRSNFHYIVNLFWYLLLIYSLFMTDSRRWGPAAPKPMIIVHACTMIIIRACTMIIVRACTMIIVRVCTVIIVRVCIMIIV